MLIGGAEYELKSHRDGTVRGASVVVASELYLDCGCVEGNQPPLLGTNKLPQSVLLLKKT